MTAEERIALLEAKCASYEKFLRVCYYSFRLTSGTDKIADKVLALLEANGAMPAQSQEPLQRPR